MRRIAVSLGLLGMLTAVVGLGISKERPELVADASDDAGGSVGTAAAPEVQGEAATDASASDADAAASPDATREEPVKLEVVGASWEVIAPGVLANGGLSAGESSAFAEAGLTVNFTAATDAADLETRLGLGGDSDGGADLALMPLPTFVASYERLRALSPQVFFVVAWSRGRDALTGDVSLVRKPPKKGSVTLAGRPGSAESVLGLFALSWAGVSPARVDVVDATGPVPKRALKSLRRRKSRQVDAREVFLSTADATRLIPIVAIAPRGVVAEKRAALAEWSRVWLQGTRDLQRDPAGAARLLASQTGAPKAVDLIDALGWMEFADLAEAAATVGLSGRRASTLDTLFSRTWDLWRQSGLIATPPPEHIPLSAVVIAELAGQAAGGVRRDPKPRRAPADTGQKPILVHRMPGTTLDTQAELSLINEAGFVADVFARSPIRITVSGNPKTAARIASAASERFGLDPARFIVVTKRRRLRGSAAMLEVLPAV